MYVVTYTTDKPKLGYVKIDLLQPNTLYSFTATCKDTAATVSKTIEVKTDYGRPSAPQDIKVSLDSKHLKISWTPPQVPAGIINNYRLMVDNNIVSDTIENTLRL